MYKRILSILFLTALFFVPSYADDYTPEQKTFRSSVMAFLKEEGFAPYIDEDNSLMFKKEGNLYWINIANDTPLFVEFYRSGLNCTDADENLVIKACNMVNMNLPSVKTYMNDGTISIVVETFCHSAEEFKYTFYKNIKALDDAYNSVGNYYGSLSEASSAPFSILSAEVANTESGGSIISGYGNTIYASQGKYLKSRITVNVKTAGTYEIYFKLYTPSGALSTGDNSPTGYSSKDAVAMDEGVHTYDLIGWGYNNTGNWSSGTYRFEYYYNGVLLGKKTFTME